MLCEPQPQLGFRLMYNLAADLAMKVRKNNTECGLLVPAEEVTMATARVITMLTQDLDAMGAELCVLLGTCKDEAERKQIMHPASPPIVDGSRACPRRRPR